MRFKKSSNPTSAKENDRRNRNFDACNWRRGRAALRALPEKRKKELLTAWNAFATLPATASSFIDFLHHRGVKIKK